jgi:hypothetical protein
MVAKAVAHAKKAGIMNGKAKVVWHPARQPDERR